MELQEKLEINSLYGLMTAKHYGKRETPVSGRVCAHVTVDDDDCFTELILLSHFADYQLVEIDHLADWDDSLYTVATWLYRDRESANEAFGERLRLARDAD